MPTNPNDALIYATHDAVFRLGDVCGEQAETSAVHDIVTYATRRIAQAVKADPSMRMKSQSGQGHLVQRVLGPDLLLRYAAAAKEAPGMTTIELPIMEAQAITELRSKHGDSLFSALASLPADQLAQVVAQTLKKAPGGAAQLRDVQKPATKAQPLTPIQQLARQTAPELYKPTGSK